MIQPVITTVPVTVKSSNQAGWWTPFAIDRDGNKYLGCICAAVSGASGYHNIAIVRQNMDGSFNTGWLRNKDGTRAEYVDDAGHNQPSVVVDLDGFIHVFTSMHTDYWRYFKSQVPGDLNTLVNSFDELPDTIWKYTYPVMTMSPTGDVYVMVRGGHSSNEFDRAGIIYRRARSSVTWERLLIISNESNRSFYPDDLRVDSNSNVNILWEWGPYGAGTLRHKGSFIISDKDGKIKNVAGVSMTTPVSVNSDGDHVYQPMLPGESFVTNDDPNLNSTPGIQTAKFIYGGEVVSGILYRHRPDREGPSSTFGGFNITVAHFKQGAWSREVVLDLNSDTISTSAALSATVNAGTERLYFCLEKISSNTTTAVLVLAVKSSATWIYYKIGNPVTAPMRIQAQRYSSSDYLYVTAPNDGKLFIYEVPLNLEDMTYFSNQADLIASL